VIGAIIAGAIAASRLLPNRRNDKEGANAVNAITPTRSDHSTPRRTSARSAWRWATGGSTCGYALQCGNVGCCDSSKNKHATAHFHETQHPVSARSMPGARWMWCLRGRGGDRMRQSAHENHPRRCRDRVRLRTRHRTSAVEEPGHLHRHDRRFPARSTVRRSRTGARAK
jgi:hypothetical protein